MSLRPSACWNCGFEFCRGHGCLSLVSVVCCQVEVSVSGWSLVQRSPTQCGVSECDHEALILKRTWPTRGCCAIGKKNAIANNYLIAITTLHSLTSYTAIILMNECISLAWWTPEGKSKPAANNDTAFGTYSLTAGGSLLGSGWFRIPIMSGK
jgi:hypothetical protein